jgi:membrane-bound lytic murein transglycosylase D
LPLIKLIFSALLGLSALSFIASTQAAEMLAMSTQLSEANEPTTLTSARNITLELIPETEQEKLDLWLRIRRGFAMRDLDSPLIARHEQWYSSRPDYMKRMTERSRRYLYYITEEVERRGMPSEIALLPMIESAFNPGAYSTSAASGIWQFIPSTGKSFGMQQNWWYDGRRDVVSATNGALDYLQKLHRQFGDWELALAAYNCGEGAIARAQQRNRAKGLPVNYSSLSIPVETRNYVPKLLAIKNIIASPERFALALSPIENQAYFAALSTHEQMDVKMFAELADITIEEFVALNPAHNRPVILQAHNDLILLPINKVETFLSNLEANKKPLLSWQSYQPKKGDRLTQLAPKLGLSVETLKSVNGLSIHSDVSNGQTLLVPLQSDEGTELTTFDVHLSPESQARELTHTVRRGETLASIAKRYHVKAANLQAWNGHAKKIQVGQTLRIVQSTHTHRHLAKHGNKSHRSASRGHKKLAAN